jgi:hypothetical protein
LFDGDAVFDELRAMIEERRRAKKKPSLCENTLPSHAGSKN